MSTLLPPLTLAAKGNFLVPLTLFGWPAFVLMLFMVLHPRRAVLATFVLSWLFLPMASYGFPGFPDYSKTTAASLSVLLGVLIFDSSRIMRFRPKIWDLPMLLLCVSPFLSAMNAGNGLYDAVSALWNQTILWGMPYFIGRVYFNDFQSFRELAIAIFLGGLLYAPFCVWEMRMGPLLHETVYGYSQHSFHQHVRLGGFRPKVFMQHGLMVAIWMTSASICGVWLWQSRAMRHILNFPLWLFVWPLIGVTVMCRSLGSMILLAMGLMVTFGMKWMRISLPMFILFAIPPVYIARQVAMPWSGEPLASLVEDFVAERPAVTFRQRLNNEQIIVDYAMQEPVFGHTRWRLRPPGEGALRKFVALDQMWCIQLSSNGLLGLAALLGTLLLPPLILVWCVRPAFWYTPAFGALGALSVIIGLHSVDNLMNAMFIPIYVVSLGGMTSIALQRQRLRAVQGYAPPPPGRYGAHRAAGPSVRAAAPHQRM